MKICVTFKPDHDEVIPALDTELKGLNDAFRREGIFTKLYKSIPKMFRENIPFDIIIENKDKLTIIDSHRVEKSAKDDGTYVFFINFNQDTLDTFDIIRMAIEKMPLHLRQQLGRVLCQDGSSLENITRDGLKKKVHRGMSQYGKVLSLVEVV